MDKKLPPLASKQLEPLLTPISEIHPHPLNYKKHPPEQIQVLRASLKAFGWTTPIRANMKGVIVAGHGMYQLSIEDGYTDIPVEKVDLDDELSKAYLIADNETARKAQNDDEQLNELLREISELPDFDIEAVGFSEEEVNNLIRDEPGEVIEDDFSPGQEVETRCKPGDLWELGNHRLLCGDSTKKEDVERLMNNNKFELLATSPPYNQGDSCGDLLHTHGLGVGIKNVKLYSTSNTDNLTAEQYYNFLISILKISFLFKNEESHTIAWNVSYNSKSRDDYGIIVFSNDNPYRVKETIIWDKSHSINLPQIGIYSRRCEFVFIMSGNIKYRTTQIYNDCRWNYWQFKSAGSQITGEEIEHRAAFPINFISQIIKDFSFENDLVFEPFCGSGTSLIACEQLNRVCYAMELDPHYCDVILTRWEKFTGKTAKRLD